MSQAFIAHGTPSLQQSDVDDLRAQPGNEELLGYFPPDILQWSPPFFSANSGAIYSWHFWVFSLILSPFVWLARIAGFADTSGYLFGNIFFSCLAAFSLLRSREYGTPTAIVGMVLFLSIGGAYYIRWPHPEIFSASLLCMGLVLLRDGRMKLAAFLVALAGQQNPPIILLIPLIFMLDVRRIFLQGSGFYWVLQKTYPWALIVLVSMLSALFYWVEFDVFNLIASSGSADVKLISVQRLSSLLFDPNLGIFWAIPFAFVASAGIFISKKSLLPNWKWVLIFFLMTVICAIPSLSTTNWNSGMEIISRYGFWCSVPLIFAFLEILNSIKNRYSRFVIIIIILLILSQMTLIVVNKILLSKWYLSYTKFHPVAEFILKKFPHWYSPVPEVFIERTLNEENIIPDAVYYIAASGEVEKILVNKDVMGTALGYICANGSAWNYVSSIDKSEMGWFYLNMGRGCLAKVNDGFHVLMPAISVHSGQTLPHSSTIFAEGWSHAEATHRWSLGEKSMLRFKSEDALSRVSISGFAHGRQRVEISLNGKHYLYSEITNEHVFEIDLSGIVPYDGETYELIFSWKDAAQASNNDFRVIAFAVSEIHFD